MDGGPTIQPITYGGTACAATPLDENASQPAEANIFERFRKKELYIKKIECSTFLVNFDAATRIL